MEITEQQRMDAVYAIRLADRKQRIPAPFRKPESLGLAKPGDTIELLHWRAGNEYDLKRGKYWQVTDTEWWIIQGDDTLLKLPRDEWEFVLR